MARLCGCPEDRKHPLNLKGDNDPQEALYQAILLRHYRERSNRHELTFENTMVEAASRNCGDMVRMYIAGQAGLLDASLIDCSYTGEGCSVSIASANMACTALQGTSRTEARHRTLAVIAFLDLLEKGVSTTAPTFLADLSALESLYCFPTRVACARLAWLAAFKILAPPIVPDPSING